MFKKILIANRGEIACRVIKTARRMGIQTVAVYSDADARAPFVKMADEAVHIGPSPAAQSYLIADKIIAACKQTGADAVHPGYGFLSERTSFAEALAAEGIAFVGLPVNAIAAMGDKIEVEEARAKGGRQCRPRLRGRDRGYRARGPHLGRDRLSSDDEGLGRRRRQGHAPRLFREGRARGLRSQPSAKALNSFGDDRVFIEKFILNPRHIEIQILGDQHGNILYLERARMLDPAPPPESGRGSTLALRDAEDAQGDGRAVRRAFPRGRLLFCRYGGADRFGRGPKRRELLLPRNEHPPAGGAPGHRGDHRHRFGGADDPRGLRAKS